MCQQETTSGGSCAYWEFDYNTDTCTTYETSDRRCLISFQPSHLDPATCSDPGLSSDCEQVGSSTSYYCPQVTSSQCSEDAPFMEGFGAETEAQCRALCDAHSLLPALGCTFYAWTPGEALNCLLYTEPFAQFLR